MDLMCKCHVKGDFVRQELCGNSARLSAQGKVVLQDY